MFVRIRHILFGPILCGISLALAILVSHPVAEMGLDDDWSYIWSANALATTGHIIYNGWATAILGWQLYMGALFMRLFGFSFFIARVSVLIIAISTVVLIQRLLRRLGMSDWNATIGTLTIALSPVLLSVAFSFMSDVPGFFCIVLCFYSCTRAIQTSSTRKTIGWLVFATISNIAGGTVRQIAWLGALLVVPSTAWHLRRRSGVAIVALALWMLSVGAISWAMHWFNQQPYSLTDALVHPPHGQLKGVLRNIALRNTLAVSLFVLPVIAGFILKLPLHDRWTRFQAIFLFILSIVVGFCGLLFRKQINLELEITNGTVMNRGLTSGSGILGRQPDMLPYEFRMLLTLLLIASLLGFILFCLNASKIKGPDWEGKNRFTWSSTGALFVPYTVAYIFLLVTRTNIFDRYLIPLILVAVAGLLRLYEQKIGGRLPSLTVGLILMFGAFGVCELHDLYARNRAVLDITNEILSTGVTRSEIRGGFEYDAWTQLQNSGYVNDPRLIVPTGAYRVFPMQPGLSTACQSWFSDLMPSLNIRFALAFDQTTCYTSSSFRAVSYNAWLPPHNRTLYVQKIP
ncbi:ArnT family glycosyltransferase [Tunturiibacter gelidoferens]|uniref:Glycosyltransferase family 39 protein n=1 Tax=Tunturiibacter gelidiferens TaxID=3069689 RepID=A0AAU7Z039_9BACT